MTERRKPRKVTHRVASPTLATAPHAERESAASVLRSGRPSFVDKIVTLQELREISQRSRRLGTGWVHCHGCFDVVHGGHLRYLEQARRAGDCLVVSLTSDRAIYKEDGTRPVVPQELRAEALAALEIVDYVSIVDAPTALPAIEAVAPALYVKGKEYAGSLHAGFVLECECVEALGGSVLFASDAAVFSSTELLGARSHCRGEASLGSQSRLEVSCQRWGVTPARLREVSSQVRGRSIAVLGDSTLDRVVSGQRLAEAADGVPRLRERAEHFRPGGAARVALDIARLGARPVLLTALASGAESERFERDLRNGGVEVVAIATRDRLPRRTWFCAGSQPLLCVSEGTVLSRGNSRRGRTETTFGWDVGAAKALVVLDPGFGLLSTEAAASALELARQQELPLIGGEHMGDAQPAGVALRVLSEQRLRAQADDFVTPLPSLAEAFMRDLAVARMVVALDRGGALLLGLGRCEAQTASQSTYLQANYIPPFAPGGAVGPGRREEPLLGASAVAQSLGLSLPLLGYWAEASSPPIDAVGLELVEPSAPSS